MPLCTHSRQNWVNWVGVRYICAHLHVLTLRLCPLCTRDLCNRGGPQAASTWSRPSLRHRATQLSYLRCPPGILPRWWELEPPHLSSVLLLRSRCWWRWPLTSTSTSNLRSTRVGSWQHELGGRWEVVVLGVCAEQIRSFFEKGTLENLEFQVNIPVSFLTHNGKRLRRDNLIITREHRN